MNTIPVVVGCLLFAVTGNLCDKRLMNLIYTLVAIDCDQFLLPTIIVSHFDRLVKKDIQPLLYRVTAIIRALIQFAAIDITYARHLGGTGVDVINMLLCAANISARKPREEYLT